MGRAQETEDPKRRAMIDIIRKTDPNFDGRGKSLAYLFARVDAMQGESSAESSPAAHEATSFVDQAHEAMLQRHANAWKK
jgi:hypothetical protein